MNGYAWITSEWCSRWHVAGRSARGNVIIVACGHPLVGRMSRVLDLPLPQDVREICQACLPAVWNSDECETVQARIFETALGVMVEHRGFHADSPLVCPPKIDRPQEDPDQPGALPRRLSDWNTDMAA